MAERILSADDQARLSVEFAGVDTNKMGEGERMRLLQLAERLANQAAQIVRSWVGNSPCQGSCKCLWQTMSV